LTQKEHWLGWLSQYLGPGAYGRVGSRDDARYAYNHVVNYKMLLWLIKASGIEPSLVEAAEQAALTSTSLAGKSGAIRRRVPWSIVQSALWRPDAPGHSWLGRLSGGTIG
jgi:hypothetical protein